MTKLSKSQVQQKAELSARIEKERDNLANAVAAFNEGLAALRDKLQAAVDGYNEAVADVESFRDDVFAEMEDYYGDKSEAWQEGDKGQAYSEWKSLWEESFAPLEMELPEDIEEPDHDGDRFDELTEEFEF